jgi:hypothetical protein
LRVFSVGAFTRIRNDPTRSVISRLLMVSS